MITKKKLFISIAVTFLVTAVIVGAFAFSIVNQIYSKQENDDPIRGEIDAAYELLLQRFYKPIDADALKTAAIDGMIAYLDDPYAAYYDQDEWQEFLLEQQGEYTGIGVQVSYDEKQNGITVTRVFDNSPAKEAGIQEGDFIFSADGETFEEVDYQGIVDAIRGEPGTTVVIKLRRGQTEIELEIVRQVVVAAQAYYEMLDDNIGYFELYTFTGDSLDQFNSAKEFFVENNAQGIIIDLRYNPGGDLGIVTGMLDALLPAGNLIITKNRDGVESTLTSDEHMWDIPLVVLVNENSASASELFSIAIQDYERGPVIGDITYGKGVVQTILPLHNGKTGIKYTSSEYFSPDGRSINQTGVTPDFEIIDEDFTDDVDPVIDKAIELLLDK